MDDSDSEDLETTLVMAMSRSKAVKIATDRWSAASRALKEIDAELAALTDRCRDIGSRRDEALAVVVRWARCYGAVRGRVGDERQNDTSKQLDSAVDSAKGGAS